MSFHRSSNAVTLSLILAFAGPALAQSRKLSGPLAPLPDASGAAHVFEFAFTPDGARALYRADLDLSGTPRLYGAPADGSGPAVALSGGRANDFALSPDGTRAAFRDGTNRLYGVPSDGSASATLLALQVLEYAFTPDGTRLLCVNQARVLFSVPAAGGPAVNLSSRGGSFVLAPDGSRVAFVFGDLATNRTELWLAPTDGSAPATLLDSSSFVGLASPRFTPDGRRVLYDDFGDLLSVSVDPVGPPGLVAPGPREYAVLPDSSGIVFTRRSGLETSPIELYAQAFAGGAPIKLNAPLGVGGDVLGVTGPDAFRLTPDGAYAVYRADQDADEDFRLHVVPLSAPGAALAIQSAEVGRFAVTPDGSRCVFEAEPTPGAPRELYSLPLDGVSTLPLSLTGAMVAGGGLVDFVLAPDSLTVAYSARQDALAVELFSVALDGGSPPVKLNAPLPPGGGVDGIIDPAFRIDGASQRVLFRADQETFELHELFSVPLAGGQAPVRLNPTLAPSPRAGDVLELALDPLGRYATYVADGTRDNAFELYRATLDGAPQPELLSAPRAGIALQTRISPDGAFAVYRGDGLYSVRLAEAGAPVRLDVGLAGTVAGTLHVSPDSARVVFLLLRDSPDAFGMSSCELYSVALDGSSPPVLLSATRSASATLEVRITPDGRRVVFSGNVASPITRELFSVPIDGSAPRTRLSAPMVALGNLSDVVQAGAPFQLDGSGRWAVYLADQEVNERFELWAVPVSGGVAPWKLNPSLVALGDVARFTVAGTRVLYLADQEVDGRFELYAVALGWSGKFAQRSLTDHPRSVKLSGPFAAGNAGVSGYAVAPGNDALAYAAQQLGDGERSLYLVDLAAHAPARRLGAGTSSNLAFSADAAHLVFTRATTVPPTVELRSVRTDGSAAPVVLSSMHSSRIFRRIQLAPDARSVVYQADPASDEVYELFAVDVGGASPPVRLNGPLPAGGDVDVPVSATETLFRITPDSNQVVYLADQDVDGVFELFASPLP